LKIKILVAPVSSASTAERVSTAIGSRLNGHSGHGCDGLIPRVPIRVALNVGCVAVSLAVLGPIAACLRVVSLHVGGVAVLLDVVRISRCVAASSVSASAIASGLCSAHREKYKCENVKFFHKVSLLVTNPIVPKANCPQKT
jgi:hypothetical protein